jgi:hypothetical protein
VRNLIIITIATGLFVSGRAVAQPAPAPATAAPTTAPAMAATSSTAPPPAPPPAAGPEATAAAPISSGLDNSISIFGVFGYYYGSSGVGLAARYQKTLSSQDFLHIPGIREDIGFEGGVDYYHYGFSEPGFADYSLNEFLFLAGIVWNFWLNDKVAIYPKLEMGFGFGSFSGLNGADPGGYGGFAFQGAAGIAYKASALTLRAEAGSGSLRLGAAFGF